MRIWVFPPIVFFSSWGSYVGGDGDSSDLSISSRGWIYPHGSGLNLPDDYMLAWWVTTVVDKGEWCLLSLLLFTTSIFLNKMSRPYQVMFWSPISGKESISIISCISIILHFCRLSLSLLIHIIMCVIVIGISLLATMFNSVASSLLYCYLFFLILVNLPTFKQEWSLWLYIYLYYSDCCYWYDICGVNDFSDATRCVPVFKL